MKELLRMMRFAQAIVELWLCPLGFMLHARTIRRERDRDGER